MSPADYVARRESLGLTQAALADRLGIARETVVRREAGHPRNPITPEAALAIDALQARRLGSLGQRGRIRYLYAQRTS